MRNPGTDRLLKAASALRASLLVMVNQVDELCDLLGTGDSTSPPTGPVEPATHTDLLWVDRGRFVVHWKGRRCTPGATMAFLVMERLASRPNQYISVDTLIDDLWTAPRAYSTVRSTVCRLRSDLRRAGMPDLAERIDGRTPGYYGLVLDDA